jgi:NAD(P)-dependent dehydrogenase (short-subunit alcohol dehydrogenase family)
MSKRVAVVTGASRGIGLALTERLAAAGRTVVALARSQPGLDAVSARTGALGLVVDVSDPMAVAEVFARIVADHGVPDLLVNNAGLSGGSALTTDLPESDWWRVMEVNVRGTYLCTRAVLPGMVARGSGRIVNLSSGAATFPVGLDNDGELTSAYMASKAAVNRFTEAVAGECYAEGVRVFALSPGMVKTDMTAEAFAHIWDDDGVWTPVERCLDLIGDIDAGRLDALSGRYLRAALDDWRAVATRADEVLALDTHVLRLRELPEP